MKIKLLMLIFIGFVLVGCGDIDNEYRLREVIKLKYPNALNFKKVEKATFKFLVQLPTGEVRYIELYGPRGGVDEISIDVEFFSKVKG